jgi:hypothetical protein
MEENPSEPCHNHITSLAVLCTHHKLLLAWFCINMGVIQ